MNNIAWIGVLRCIIYIGNVVAAMSYTIVYSQAINTK